MNPTVSAIIVYAITAVIAMLVALLISGMFRFLKIVSPDDKK